MGTLSSIKDFGLGTVKGAIGDGWKGFKAGLMVAAAIGVGVGLIVTGAGAAAGWGIAAGVLFGGASLPATASWGASIGAAWGTLFGGTREMKKSGQTKEQSLEAARANAEHRVAKAQQTGMNIRHAISRESAVSAAALPGPSRATNYQMHNPLAEGKAPNHFTNQFASQKDTVKDQQVSTAGRGQ